MQAARRASAARGRQGFTLIELLIVIGIAIILIGLLMPALTRSRDAARRASDLEGLHQLVIATSAYTQDFDGWLPPGGQTTITRTNPPPPNGNPDDYTWMSYQNCWQLLQSRVPGLAKTQSCYSVLEGYAYAYQFDAATGNSAGTRTPLASSARVSPAGSGWHGPDDVEVGWIYWGGRDDLYTGTNLTYRSPSHMGATGSPSSTTLWTCRAWDSKGTGVSSSCPHVGHHYIEYPSGVVLGSQGFPHPDGIGIAKMDGSANFTFWPATGVTNLTGLRGVTQANGFMIYYAP